MRCHVFSTLVIRSLFTGTLILKNPWEVASFVSYSNSKALPIHVRSLKENYYLESSTIMDYVKKSPYKLKQEMVSSCLQSSRQNNNEHEPPNDLSIGDNQDDKGFLPLLGLVIPLLTVFISNQWSRSSLYYLVDFSSSSSSISKSSFVQDRMTNSFYAMNLDIGFDQAQYGLLASLGFTALFAIASLFAGNLADKYNRKYLTVGSAIVWSIATYTTSIASSYDEVFASRVVMGLACAFSTPCGYTLLKDTVPSSKLSLANSLYGSGVYFGGGLSSLSLLLDERFGWRMTCLSIAGYGLMAALLASLLLPNDPKKYTDIDPSKKEPIQEINNQSKMDESNSSLFRDVQEIILSNKRLQWLFLGSFSRFCAGLCIGVWAAPYYKLAFPNDSASYAVINAFIVGICGVLSGLIGGYTSDKFVGNNENEKENNENNSIWSLDENGSRLIVPILGSLLAIPTWWLTSHSKTFEAAMIWLSIEYLVAECWFGPTVAVLQSEVRKGQGGIAQGMFTLTGAIGNLAPSLLGYVYSRQITGDNVDVLSSDMLSNILGMAVCGGYLVSAICFGICATTTTSKYSVVKSE